MTNERAIELLNRISDSQFDGIHGDERREALEMAVKALEGDGDTISRKMAIDAFVKYVADGYAESPNDFEGYMEIVKKLPSAQPETHDKRTETHECDLISRQAAIDAVAKWFYDVFGIKESDGTATIFKRLRELPSAQPQLKKGKWINHRNDDGHNIADCDQCGNAIQWFDGDEIPRYCCMCGADMRTEGNDDN